MSTVGGPGAPPRRGRGRPPRISQDQIVETAIQLGLDSFSMQGIADALGVTPPALYSHVAGREEVLELVNEALRSRLRTFSTPATDWRAWMEDFGRSARRHLAGSGSSLMVELRNPGTSGSVGIGEGGLQLLIDAGLTPAEAGYALWLVFRLAITAGPEADPTVSGYLGDAEQVLAPDTAQRYPATKAVHDELVAKGTADAFEFDLQVVLDGLAHRLESRSPRSRATGRR